MSSPPSPSLHPGRGLSRLAFYEPSNHVVGSTMPCQNRNYQPSPRTSSHQNKPLVIRFNYVRARRLTGCAQTVSFFLLPVPLRTTSIAPSPPIPRQFLHLDAMHKPPPSLLLSCSPLIIRLETSGPRNKVALALGFWLPCRWAVETLNHPYGPRPGHTHVLCADTERNNWMMLCSALSSPCCHARELNFWPATSAGGGPSSSVTV